MTLRPSRGSCALARASRARAPLQFTSVGSCPHGAPHQAMRSVPAHGAMRGEVGAGGGRESVCSWTGRLAPRSAWAPSGDSRSMGHAGWPAKGSFQPIGSYLPPRSRRGRSRHSPRDVRCEVRAEPARRTMVFAAVGCLGTVIRPSRPPSRPPPAPSRVANEPVEGDGELIGCRGPWRSNVPALWPSRRGGRRAGPRCRSPVGSPSLSSFAVFPRRLCRPRHALARQAADAAAAVRFRRAGRG